MRPPRGRSVSICGPGTLDSEPCASAAARGAGQHRHPFREGNEGIKGAVSPKRGRSPVGRGLPYGPPGRAAPVVPASPLGLEGLPGSRFSFL